MSSGQILFRQQEFRALVSRFESSTNALSELRYNTDKGSLRLSSVDTLENCLRELNRATTEFRAITGADVRNCRALESRFVETDRNLGRMFD